MANGEIQSASLFNHDQETASASWEIQHNLNTSAPVVDVWIMLDGLKQKMLPLSVIAVDANNCTVNFTVARSGAAAIR
jgi:hypothetical protein